MDNCKKHKKGTFIKGTRCIEGVHAAILGEFGQEELTAATADVAGGGDYGVVVFEIHSGYTKQWLTAQSSKAKSEREAECKNRRYHTYVSHWDQIKVKTLVKR
eukprot:scaffold4795_cov191-Skeletonema_marinoi.AAC.9